MKKLGTFIRWFFLAIASIFAGGSLYSSNGKPISKNDRLVAATMFFGIISIIILLTKIKLL